MSSVTDFLNKFFQGAQNAQIAMDPELRMKQQQFNAENAYKQQELQQRTAQFTQENALKEREFGQKQQYQNLLEQQRQDTLKESRDKAASGTLDALSLKGAKYLPTPTGPITQTPILGGQQPAAPIPGVPAAGTELPQISVPAAFQGPQGYNKVPTPPELTGLPSMQGTSIYLPTTEESARQTAAGKATEAQAGQPIWSQEQIDALKQIHPSLPGVLGAQPGQHYDPNNKLMGDLVTHMLTKKANDTGLNDQWKMTVAAEAKKRGVDPGDLPPEVLGGISKQMADDKERTDQHTLAMLTAQSKEEKEAALKSAGESFGQAVLDNPDTFVPKDSQTQQATRQWLMNNAGVGMPSKLGQRAGTNEDFARRAIQSVNTVKNMMADPDFTSIIERRGGPGWGRVGNLEQTIGKGYGMTPQDEARIQQFRAALNYMTFQEGQSLFGGRIPIQLMQQLQTTSPNIKQDKGTLNGALSAVKRNAEDSLISYEKARFGGSVRPNFWEKNNIQKRDPNGISEAKISRPSDLMQTMEDGDQKIIADSSKKEHLVVRRNDPKTGEAQWFERAQ